jgi:hypothetical protein
MTESEWLTSWQPVQLLQYLGDRPADRSLRLFACAAARQILHMLRDARSRQAVEVAERYADGLADEDELQTAGARAAHLADEMQSAGATGWNAARTTALTAAAAASVAAQRAAAAAADADTVREVFGNPFRPRPAVESEWLAWNGAVVPKLARSMYDERRFTDMPVLADALEDAGCDDADLLEHLRGPARHVRGCWAVDLLLGKE